jgi:hypothetical protein
MIRSPPTIVTIISGFDSFSACWKIECRGTNYTGHSPAITEVRHVEVC